MIRSSLIDGKYLLNSKADLGKAGGGGRGGCRVGGAGVAHGFYFLLLLIFLQSLWRTTNCVVWSWTEH